MGADEPRRLGPYELLEELGRGNHGVVFRARRAGLLAECALKVVPATGGDEAQRRFEREARVASRLEHRGVVRVHDFGRDGLKLYYAMELCPGPTLQDELRGAPLPPGRVREVVLELAETLAYAHEQGVVHRDLKPANIVLDPHSRRPRITDFGLAQDKEGMESLTRTGDLLGTPLAMAPEQLLGEARTDEQVDVYALGAIFYRALTGRPPYDGANLVELAEQVLSGEPPPRPRSLGAEISRDLEAVCLQMLDRDPRGRPSARAVADLLNRCDASGESEPAPPTPKAPTGRAAIAAGVGAGLVLGGLAAAWALAGGSGPGEVAEAAPADPAPLRPPAPALPAPAPTPEPEPAPASPPRQLTPAQLERMHRLLEGLHELQSAAAQGRADQLEGLVREAPEDGRARAAWGQALVCAGRYHDGRRQLMRALHLDPPPPPGFVDFTGRVCHMLGFERAGADVGETLFAGGAVPPPERGVFLVQIYLKASSPVAHPARARDLAQRLIDAKLPGTKDAYPETWMLWAHVSDAWRGLGDAEEAARAWERAAPIGPDPAGFRARAARIRAEGVDPARMGRSIELHLTQGAFLVAVRRLDGLADRGREGEAARQFEALARGAEVDALVERAALAWLRAARDHRRAGDLHAARLALEAAWKLRLPEDTRLLVARRLARHLQVYVPGTADRVIALAREAADPLVSGTESLRTSGERLDALVLLAQGYLSQGRWRDAARLAPRFDAEDAVDRRETGRVLEMLER